jgi:hypothetical protein
MKKRSRKGTRTGKKRKRLTIKELEKKVAPSGFIGKKPAIPGPYAPGTYYGLAKRSNIE